MRTATKPSSQSDIQAALDSLKQPKRKAQSAVPELLFQLRAHRLSYEQEVKFHPTRKWRFDVLVKGQVAVEVDGGGFVQGRHSRGAGIENDCIKFAEAMMQGYQVLRVTPRQIKNGLALKWIERLVQP